MPTPSSPAQELATPAPIWGHRPVLWVLLLAAGLFALRVSAPPNLLDQDQENPATYVLDIVKNGNWLCQRDLTGAISSKPPLWAWLAALAALPAGRISLFSIYLPGALAIAGSSVLVYLAGRRQFGERAGLFGALAGMLCTAGLKEFGLARTDAVFACLVTGSAWLAFQAWMRGGGWTWFWLAAAAGTLTKGPLAVLLGSFGLLASLWERWSGERKPVRGSHLPGVALFAGITAGWLALAYGQLGQPVLDKLLLRELVFHAVEGEHKRVPGSLLYLSPLYYLARAAPWSLLAYYGFWRIWRTPAAQAEERRFERFLFCWFGAGLFLFSMSPHQRGDLLWPILPAGALVAGRELDRLTASMDRAKTNRALLVLLAVALAGYSFFYFGPRAQNRFIQQTLATRELARQIEQRGGPEFPLTHTDDPAGLQVYLNTYRPPVGFEEAAALLRGPEAAYVAVTDLNRLKAVRRADDPPFYTLAGDEGPVARLQAQVISNRPGWAWEGRAALGMGPWLVRYEGRLRSATNERLEFDGAPAPGAVSLTNRGREPARVRVRFRGAGEGRVLVQIVPAGGGILLPPP